MNQNDKTKAIVILLIFALLTFIFTAGHTAASSEKDAAGRGAEILRLEGGPLGEVPFPHRKHQERIKECSSCHDLFPQKAGAIAARKKAGELKKQQVMNQQCIECHMAQQKAGKNSGPTTCSACHQR